MSPHAPSDLGEPTAHGEGKEKGGYVVYGLKGHFVSTRIITVLTRIVRERASPWMRFWRQSGFSRLKASHTQKRLNGVREAEKSHAPASYCQ